MPCLYWFHAVRQDDVDVLTSVLRSGRDVAPRDAGKTSQLEITYEITPPRIYCYLGRTLEAFGAFAFALASVASPGEMSPFDSGGIEKHTPPVSSWPKADRVQYLQDFSWPTTDLPTLLPQYPGMSVADVSRYLDATQRPILKGPHEVWSGRKSTAAEIWSPSSPSDWRAWTWEGRFQQTLPVDDGLLVGWTCPPARHAQLLRWADTIATKSEQQWARRVLPKWIRGGLHGLIEHLKIEQAAP